jgi:hypothetical protein
MTALPTTATGPSAGLAGVAAGLVLAAIAANTAAPASGTARKARRRVRAVAIARTGPAIRARSGARDNTSLRLRHDHRGLRVAGAEPPILRRATHADTEGMKRKDRPPRTGPLSADEAARQYRAVRRALWGSDALCVFVVVTAVLSAHHDQTLIIAIATILGLLYVATSIWAMRIVKENLSSRVGDHGFEQPQIGL